MQKIQRSEKLGNNTLYRHSQTFSFYKQIINRHIKYVIVIVFIVY